MTRDDSSGGWLPTNGGGMSVVGVHAAPPPANLHYMIRGRRVCDHAVSLARRYIAHRLVTTSYCSTVHSELVDGENCFKL